MMWVAAMYNVLAVLSMTVFKVFCYNSSRKHPRRIYFEFMEADNKHLYSFVGSHICCHVVRCVTMASVCELIWETPFSCDLVVPRPSPHVRQRGSGVLSDFSCQMGRGSSRSGSPNQIAERVIICNDVDNRA